MPRKKKLPEERKRAPGAGRKKVLPEDMVRVEAMISRELLDHMDKWIAAYPNSRSRAAVIRDGISVITGY